MKKFNSNKLYTIRGLSKKENIIFSENVSLIDNYKFFIPYTSEDYIAVIEKLAKSVPFLYIVREKENTVKSLNYEIKNDYIIVTFSKEERKELCNT